MQDFNDLSGLDVLDEMFYGPGGKQAIPKEPDYSNPAGATRGDVEKAIVKWRADRDRRLEAEKVAKKIKEAEDAAKSFILEAFKQQKFEGMLIDGRTTGLATKSVPTVCDKELLVAYIKETGELDLLQFHLSAGAVKERTEAGISVPGTEYVDVYDLFDRKV